jgi:hypothetical protein
MRFRQCRRSSLSHTRMCRLRACWCTCRHSDARVGLSPEACTRRCLQNQGMGIRILQWTNRLMQCNKKPSRQRDRWGFILSTICCRSAAGVAGLIILLCNYLSHSCCINFTINIPTFRIGSQVCRSSVIISLLSMRKVQLALYTLKLA